MAFAIKAEVCKPQAETFAFAALKTMYDGKRVGEGDMVYVFASENEGGKGLVARGVVSSAEECPSPLDAERWTPRVSIAVRRTALAKRPLGRRELKPFS